MNTSELNIALECAIRQEATGLRVGYRVRNAHGTPIGLFNQLAAPHLDGTLSYAPEHVYVDFEAPTLSLRKRVLPIPEGLRMAERETPAVTLLPDGQAFQEEFFLSAPVAVRNPFRRAALAGSSPGSEVVVDVAEEAFLVVFEVGVFAVEAGWRLVSVSPGYPEVYRVWPPGPAVDAQVVLRQEARLARPLPVLDYRLVEPPSKEETS